MYQLIAEITVTYGEEEWEHNKIIKKPTAHPRNQFLVEELWYFQNILCQELNNKKIDGCSENSN